MKLLPMLLSSVRLSLVALLLLSGKVLVLFLLSANVQVRAEGTWQMGLFEGTSHLQYLYETNAANGYNYFNVDILTPGEVINVHTCGIGTTDNIRVTIEDSFGSVVYDNAAPGTICGSDLNTTFDPAVTNPHQYVTPSTGTYVVSFSNEDHSYLSRYDVTVTNSVNALVDPREEGGRVWSLYWYFNANGYSVDVATDANLYVVADGGFEGTYFTWRLDLNNFAGFVYSLKANDLGVTSPNAAGDVVAGLSVPVANNSIQEKYPIYLGYPAKSYPAPIGGLNISGLSFVDSDGEDSGISPGSTSTIQDSGTFQFNTDLTSTGVYEIIIDIGSPTGGGPDGVYGQGDIFLRGNALPGVNSVVWNGEDNNGNIIPQGAYTASLSVRTGEFHFTAYDVETSGGAGDVGIRIYRAQPSGGDLPTTIFWDDATVLNSTTPNAFNQEGLFDGDHNWGNFSAGGIGNNAYIDTYAYGRVEEPNPIGVAITENDIPLPVISKSFSPSTITTGGTSTLQLDIDYNGILALTGVSFQDTMPAGMTLVSDPASIAVSGAGCSGFVFSAATVAGGNVLDMIDGNIDANSTCTITAQVTVNLPGEFVNTTSGISSNELASGVVSNGASLSVLPVSGGPAYACDGTFYTLDSTGTSTRLYTVDQSTDPYTRQEFTSAAYSPSTGYTYTGLAYNPTDNFMYAIVNQSDELNNNPGVGSILRIDNSGAVTNMGVPVGGPNTMGMPVVSDRFTGATIGRNGRYIVVTDIAATSNAGNAIPVVERGLVLDIDLSSSPPVVLYNRRHGRDAGDIVAHPDSNYYAYNTVEGLVSIDPSSGAVTVVGGDITDSVSGLMADAQGIIYAHTDTGNLYSVDVASGNGTLVSALAATSAADAASCAFGLAVTKGVSAIEVAPGSSVTYTLSLTNSTDSPITFDLNDALNDARTVVADSLVNPLGGTVNNYAGASELVITGAALAANSTADITFDVYYPPSYPMGPANNQAIVSAGSLGMISSDFPATIIKPDQTPVEVLPNTSVGVSKKALANGVDISYEIKLENLGNTVAANVALADNLDTVFGAGNYAMTVAPMLVVDPGTLVLNTAFDGTAANASLLNVSDAGSLDIGARAVIRFSVRVTSITDVGGGTGVFSNQVEILAEDLDGNVVNDLSVDGENPDPDDDGIPAEQSATVTTVLQVIQVSGVVFNDNGANAAGNGGASHDGLRSIDEQPVAGVTVEARDGAVVIASATTSADGSYSLTLPAGYGNTLIQIVTVNDNNHRSISEYFGEDPGNTGIVTDGTVAFTPQLAFAGTYHIDFGLVVNPGWEADSIIENTPAAAVVHAHYYFPRTSGQLSFDIAGQSSIPGNSAWQALLFLDENCNGALDVGEPALPSSLNVDVDTSAKVCVLSKVFIPADASGGDTYTYDINATLIYGDPAGTAHGLTDTRSLTDLTSVIASGEGLLVLSKTVQNISAGGPVSSSNSALPGQVLHYSIDFANTGDGPITEVQISDSTPAFTGLSAPVQCPSSLPDGMASCQVLVPGVGENFAGYSGPVRWQFAGPMLAGAAGTVGYHIIVE